MLKIWFLVTDSKNIVHYLKNNNFHRDNILGFYSPIVKLIYHLPFDGPYIDKAYNNYKDLLDSLPKHSEYAPRDLTIMVVMIGVHCMIKWTVLPKQKKWRI